ncbi:MAG: hypothetical protein M1816_002283 [Peltula sp. TS41687]|nr:MAG: hypothetical protein M1816_002283 [Peltula sp. TS41687]
MTIPHETGSRAASQKSSGTVCLEDRFEILKDDIGDGSFGSVALARVRTAGAQVARRGTLVAIKTMKKTFESFTPCLELREVIFLRTLPNHAHLVPALDIFLDPISKKLHICMEYMDGNLYQLMKARDHKCMDTASVKSILFQILSGLEHIHAHHFFHRDVKPENILVSTSAPQDAGTTFRRYSALSTPPSTPPTYIVKIADFGLARETQSKLPYTTYVSTRWYRAPEVLLRAGEYSAPVDIWAIGAMAVEVATLKPLFPGTNEVDQMAPHSMETILQSPHWPSSLSNFVTWCLMWDPKNRPTSTQALKHEFFADAVDPLRPKSAASRLLGRKHSDLSHKSKDGPDGARTLNSKPSWFRRSIIGRDALPAASQQTTTENKPASPRPTPAQSTTVNNPPTQAKSRPAVEKRLTWTNGLSGSHGAPMPILPTIRPISPLSDAVTAQANGRSVKDNSSGAKDDGGRRRIVLEEKAVKKIGRQLSVASHGNHYADLHRQEAERALNGNTGLVSPPNGQKESFFSHLRKRARRLSGRNQLGVGPATDDVEANAGCGPWSSNRSSMAVDQTPAIMQTLDQAESREAEKGFPSASSGHGHGQNSAKSKGPAAGESSASKVVRPLAKEHLLQSIDNSSVSSHVGGPVSSRTRRALQKSAQAVPRYETPDEAEELLNDIIHTAHAAVRNLEKKTETGREKSQKPKAYADPSQQPLRNRGRDAGRSHPYPTPSPSASHDNGYFGQTQNMAQVSPIDIKKNPYPSQDTSVSKWPTPPYEENEWAAAAAASIYAAGAAYR